MSNKSKQIIVLKLHTQKRVTGNENCTLSIWSYGNISNDFSEIMHLLSIIKPINHILVGSTIIIAHITLQKSLLPSFLSSDLKHIFCITNTRIWLIRIIIIQDSSSSRPQNRYGKKKTSQSISLVSGYVFRTKFPPLLMITFIFYLQFSLLK